MNLWFFIALSCAFLTACCDAVSKRIMVANDEWITGTGLLALSTLFLLPIVAGMELRPVSLELIAVLAVALPLEVLGYYLFLSAIRIAPLSLTVPLLAFSPVMTILTSWLLVGERVSWTGTAGICLVTVGAYVLNANLAIQGLLAPLRALLSNPGSRRMFAVAAVWSVTSSLGKKGILIYGAIPFGFVLICCDVAVFVLICLIRYRMGWAQVSFKREIPAFFFGSAAHGRSRVDPFRILEHGPGIVHDFGEKAQPGVRSPVGLEILRREGHCLSSSGGLYNGERSALLYR